MASCLIPLFCFVLFLFLTKWNGFSLQVWDQLLWPTSVPALSSQTDASVSDTRSRNVRAASSANGDTPSFNRWTNLLCFCFQFAVISTLQGVYWDGGSGRPKNGFLIVMEFTGESLKTIKPQLKHSTLRPKLKKLIFSLNYRSKLHLWKQILTKLHFSININRQTIVQE